MSYATLPILQFNPYIGLSAHDVLIPNPLTGFIPFEYWPHITVWYTSGSQMLAYISKGHGKDVRLNGSHTLGRLSDAGLFIPHFDFGLWNIMLPFTFIFGSSNTCWGTSSVVVGCHCPIMGNSDCDIGCSPFKNSNLSIHLTCCNPVSLPLDFVITYGTVYVNFSWGDLVACLIDIAIQIAVECGAKLLCYGGKLALKKIFASAGKKVVEEAVEKVATKAVDEAVEEAGEDVAKKATEEAVEDASKKASEDVGKKVSEDVAEEVAEDAGGSGAEQAAKKAAQEVGDDAADEAISDVIKDSAEDALKESAESTVSNIGKDASEELSENVDRLRALSIVEEASGDLAEDAAEDASKKASEDVGKKVSEDVAEEVAEDAGGSGAEQAAKKAAQEVGEDATEEATEETTKKSWKQTVKETVQESWDKFTEGTKENWDKFTTATKESWDSFTTATKDSWDELVTATKNKWEAFTTAFGDGWKAFKKTCSAIYKRKLAFEAAMLASGEVGDAYLYVLSSYGPKYAWKISKKIYSWSSGGGDKDSSSEDIIGYHIPGVSNESWSRQWLINRVNDS